MDPRYKLVYPSCLHWTISIHMLMYPSHLGYISRTDVSSDIFFQISEEIPTVACHVGSGRKILGPNNDRRVNAV